MIKSRIVVMKGYVFSLLRIDAGTEGQKSPDGKERKKEISEDEFNTFRTNMEAQNHLKLLHFLTKLYNLLLISPYILYSQA